MVNIHISFEKSNFKSKNSIDRFKRNIKELHEKGYNVELIDLHLSTKDYLKEEFIVKSFKLDGVGDDIFVKLIDIETNTIHKDEPKEPNKVKSKLKRLQDIRNGKHQKELKEVKKNSDKDLFKKYEDIKKISDAPIQKPNVLINDSEKYKDEIEIFSSGYLEVCKDEKLNEMIVEYYRLVARKLNLKILSRDEFIVKYYDTNSSQLDPILLGNNSDTESD